MSASVSWWSEFENGFFSHLSVSAKRCDKSDSVVLGDSSSLSPQKVQAGPSLGLRLQLGAHDRSTMRTYKPSA